MTADARYALLAKLIPSDVNKTVLARAENLTRFIDRKRENEKNTREEENISLSRLFGGIDEENFFPSSCESKRTIRRGRV